MQASPRAIRIVIAWNVVLTLGALGLAVAVLRPRDARFTELSTERINIEDADGIPRMVISNRDRFPDLVIAGKHGRRSDRKVLPAGIVVYDEQGNEAGGYGTTAMSDGRGGNLAGSMLLFDYGASEAIGLVQRHGAASGEAMLLVSDPAPADANAGVGARRVTLGTADRAASLELADTRGRPRLRLAVDAHDRFLLDAFQAQGIAYLVKPFGAPELAAALAKYDQLRRGFAARGAADLERLAHQLAASGEHRRHFTVRAGRRIQILPLDRVALIALGLAGIEIIDLHGKSHAPSSDGSLTEIERRLPPPGFFRINRTEIVALAAIDQLSPDGDRIAIVVKGLTRPCVVSGHRAAAFRRWVGMT